MRHSPHLVEGVGPGPPPGQEDGQANRLKDLGRGVDADGVEGPLLGEELDEDTRGGGGGEDEAAQVGGSLVAQGAGGVDEGADAVALKGGADEAGAPGDGGTGGLLGAEELLLGVGLLGALVGLAEERREDGQLDAVVEEGAQRDGRGLDGGEVWQQAVSANSPSRRHPLSPRPRTQGGGLQIRRVELTVQAHDGGLRG